MRDPSNKLSNPDATMSLGDHLEELRFRLIRSLLGLVIGLVICLCFSKYIITFIEQPYIGAMGSNARLQSLAPADGIVSYIRISLIAGLILSSPWIFYQIWMFVAAGLYAYEKHYVYIVTPFSAILFTLGALFFILVVAPLTLRFLITFNQNFLGVTSNFTFSHYISFITVLMLVFGVAFQTPIAIYFLTHTGLVSIKQLKSSRGYVLFSIVILAAMATPPDVVSQLTLAAPLYLLFELGIILSHFSFQKKDKPTA